MEKKEIILIGIFLLILITTNISVFYFINERFEQSIQISKQNLNETKNELEEQINQNKLETQSQINSLTDAITSISSAQTDLKKQLSIVKAKTSADFSGIIEDKIRGVVTIKTDVSQGSGFIITNNGFIITNSHVLANARLSNVYTFDNEKHSAILIGYSPVNELDIAILKIDGEFSKLDLGDSEDVKIGEKVIAIGNPLGLSFTATEGIISSKNRIGKNNLPYYFQTDVPLNPGNSGGPLINTEGKVIGINNFKLSGADNIGFALEINYAIKKINEISLTELNQTIL